MPGRHMNPNHEVAVKLRDEHEECQSWAKIGAKYEVSGGMVWRIVNDPDYEPKDPEARGRLGLPVYVGVTPVRGDITTGSEALPSYLCASCGKSFISNHGRRKYCYSCSPYRGKRLG